MGVPTSGAIRIRRQYGAAQGLAEEAVAGSPTASEHPLFDSGGFLGGERGGALRDRADPAQVDVTGFQRGEGGGQPVDDGDRQLQAGRRGGRGQRQLGGDLLRGPAWPGPLRLPRRGGPQRGEPGLRPQHHRLQPGDPLPYSRHQGQATIRITALHRWQAAARAVGRQRWWTAARATALHHGQAVGRITAPRRWRTDSRVGDGRYRIEHTYESTRLSGHFHHLAMAGPPRLCAYAVRVHALRIFTESIKLTTKSRQDFWPATRAPVGDGTVGATRIDEKDAE